MSLIIHLIKLLPYLLWPNELTQTLLCLVWGISFYKRSAHGQNRIRIYKDKMVSRKEFSLCSPQYGNEWIWHLVQITSNSLYCTLVMSLGAHLNIKTIFPGMEIHMIKIRRWWDRLIFIMGIPILVRWHLCIDMAPRQLSSYLQSLEDRIPRDETASKNIGLLPCMGSMKAILHLKTASKCKTHSKHNIALH